MSTVLGKEVGNRWTGLFAMLLLGIADVTNILARVGMRLVLTPVFVAPVLFYLLRGLRTQRRNDLIIAGVLLGLGLMGYSAFRIMPFVVVLCVIIYLARVKNRDVSIRLFTDFGILVLFAIVAALPLLRFALQYPELIGMRTLTRMTSVEQSINGPVYLVFLNNLWNAIVMPFWRDGNTWVIAVTDVRHWTWSARYFTCWCCTAHLFVGKKQGLAVSLPDGIHPGADDALDPGFGFSN
jgi:hypothetical protein